MYCSLNLPPLLPFSFLTLSHSFPPLLLFHSSVLLSLSSLSFIHSFSTMPINKDPTTPPPPMIGKIGPYTVFMTPPSTPKPPEPVFDSPKKVVSPPPVQPPPQQFEKSVSGQAVPNGSVVGFFKNAVCKVQNAHSSLDDHLARWFGLNQSKYQWALDDYYESKGLEKNAAKTNEMSSKVRSV